MDLLNDVQDENKLGKLNDALVGVLKNAKKEFDDVNI